MFRLRRAFPVLLAALVFSLPANAQEKVELRLRLEKGQTFDQVIAMEQKISQTYSNRRTDWIMTSRFGIHNEVINADERSSVIKTTYKYAISEASVDSKNIERYDSRKPSKVMPSSAIAVAAFVGQSLTTTVSARGEVLKIEGMQIIVERLFDLMKISSELRAQITKTLSEASKSQPGQFIQFAQLPERPVAVGDSWTVKNNRSAIAPIFASTRYTLFSRQNQRLILLVRSSTLTPGTADFEATGNQTGVVNADENTGLIHEYQIHQRTSGQFKLKPQKKVKSGGEVKSWWIYAKTTLRGWTIAPPRTAP